MKAPLLLVTITVMLVQGVRAERAQVGFEEVEGYHRGASQLGANWVVSGTVVIDGEEKSAGSQSLKIEPGVSEVHYIPKEQPQEGVRFAQVNIKAVAMEAAEAQSALSVWGSTIGFVKTAEGKVSVVAADGKREGAFQTEATEVAAGEDGLFQSWLTLTVRQDLKRKTWDLYVDGRLAAIDLGMESEGVNELVLFGQEQAATHGDDLILDKDNPLFLDQDKDGMADAEEEAQGLNPWVDDRNSDLDGDGVRNIEEYRQSGTATAAGGTRPLGSLLYVDNLHGSDANNGARSYVVGGDGPKASIKAAMAAAKEGDTIVILPGKGLYEEGSRGAPGKRLTLKALSHVTIK